MADTQSPQTAINELNMADLIGRFKRFFGARDTRPAHVIDTERRPRDYFNCGACGDGPWHYSWYGEEDRFRDLRRRHRVPLGPCCTGAD